MKAEKIKMSLSEVKANQYVETYYEDIYKFCCAKCRNADDASDITQEAFVIFLKNRKEINDTFVRAYLYKIAGNKLHEYFREIKKENNYVQLDECEYIEYEDTYNIDTDEEDGRPLSEEEFEELLNDTQRRIMNILSPSEKVLFYKLYIEKKSIKLVSEETGYSEGNVRVKSHRIRKKAKDTILTSELLIMVIIFKATYR